MMGGRGVGNIFWRKQSEKGKEEMAVKPLDLTLAPAPGRASLRLQ